MSATDRPPTLAATMLLLVVAAALLGCTSGSSRAVDEAQAGSVPAGDQTARERGALRAEPMSRPSSYTLSVRADEHDPSKSLLSWTVRVNTGGYRLRTDHVTVDPAAGASVAKVYVVLEGPGRDEPVGQAFQTLQGSETVDAKVDRAELWIRRTTRGSDANASFELAATSDGAKK